MRKASVNWKTEDRFRVQGGSVEHVVAEYPNDNILICACGVTSPAAAAHPTEGRKLCKVSSYNRARTGQAAIEARKTLSDYADWLDSRAAYVIDRKGGLAQAAAIRHQAASARAYRDARFPPPRA